ncbi:MAG: DUF1533 domain-containing protein [Syntrophomonadaceae bacterium]|jgi:hypothetical protein|nr:DUF1533 domain-containing protein [Syntrophomonadaceae bacterium]
MHLMNRGLKPHSRKLIACMVVVIMFFGILGLGNLDSAYAKTEWSEPADHFEVWLIDSDTGNKTHLVTYTFPELEQMPQVERAYSSTDSLPAPVFTAARGIDLIDFLESLMFDMGTVEKFKFRATDFDADNFPPNYGKVLQASDLLDPDRYYFPKIQECWDEYWDEDMENPSNTGVPGNFIDGSDEYTRAEQQLVRPMLGIISYGCRAITSDPGKPVNTEPRFDLMDGTTRLRLCYGQKYPSECITMHFLKWTYKIEVTGKRLEGAPPVVKVDSINNTVGNNANLTFIDDEDWRNAISAVYVNDTTLVRDSVYNSYTVEAGQITIGKDLFPSEGEYNIKIEADNYLDLNLKQQVIDSSAPSTQYEVTPVEDAAYTIGATPDGIRTMTVNSDYSGMKYFGVQVTPVIEHEGVETLVFNQWRDDTQLTINAIRVDFDVVQEAQAGFNVQPGDIIKVYIVDQLSNDAHRNPVPFLFPIEP